jgi:hypothetical protein
MLDVYVNCKWAVVGFPWPNGPKIIAQVRRNIRSDFVFQRCDLPVTLRLSTNTCSGPIRNFPSRASAGFLQICRLCLDSGGSRRSLLPYQCLRVGIFQQPFLAAFYTEPRLLKPAKGRCR